MPKVIVAGAVLECSHGGKIRLTSGDPRLKVAGKDAVTSGMEVGLAFGAPEVPVPNMVAPCPIKTATVPSAPSPCAATLAATAGVATRLTVGTVPVLLDTATGATINPQSPGTWRVSDPGQTLFEAK